MPRSITQKSAKGINREKDTKRENNMTRTLRLTVKKKWFDMIKSGEKTEEYREVKRYWTRRLSEPPQCPNEWVSPVFYKFSHVLFVNGYGNTRPRVLKECKGITIGRGNPKWGAPIDRDVFIIQLGKEVTK